MAAAAGTSAAMVSHYSTTTKFQSFTPHSQKVRTFSLKITSCLSLKQSNDLTSQNDAVPFETLRVVFAAAGTGGHIYPAVAIADELRNANPNAQFLFLGAPRSMESRAVPSAGYDFAAVVSSAKLRRSTNLLLPCHLIKSVIRSYYKLREFDPHVVIGTGGYVSFPVGIAAAMKRGVKLVIQEQNAVPGFANWALSFLSDVVFVAFNSTIDCFPKWKKCVVCGNPVRLSLKKNVSKAAARRRFFPESEEEEEEGVEVEKKMKVLLVLGGSLGANAINIALLNLYYQMLLEKEDLLIIWQTGVEAYNEMESLVKNHPRLLLKPFMHKMDLAYAAADLVVSRAGALTCYEILATGKPSILIPSPDNDEGHQFKNASLMADLAGSRVITEDELDSTTLANAIEEILGDESKMADMSERALKAVNSNASVEIAQHVLSLVHLSRAKMK